MAEVTDDDLAERIAIKLVMASDVYPDNDFGRRRAEIDARAEAEEWQRRQRGSDGYEQRKLF